MKKTFTLYFILFLFSFSYSQESFPWSKSEPVMTKHFLLGKQRTILTTKQYNIKFSSLRYYTDENYSITNNPSGKEILITTISGITGATVGAGFFYGFVRLKDRNPNIFFEKFPPEDYFSQFITSGTTFLGTVLALELNSKFLYNCPFFESRKRKSGIVPFCLNIFVGLSSISPVLDYSLKRYVICRRPETPGMNKELYMSTLVASVSSLIILDLFYTESCSSDNISLEKQARPKLYLTSNGQGLFLTLNY